MVDCFDGDAAGGRFADGRGGVAVEAGPGFFVDLCLNGGAQRFVRIAGAKEVGVADEEALFVVAGVDEPAGYAIGAVASDLARVGVEDVHSVHSDLD